jgi:hypothetical protein
LRGLRLWRLRRGRLLGRLCWQYIGIRLGHQVIFWGRTGFSSKAGKPSSIRKSEAAKLHNRRIFKLVLEWCYARDYSEPISNEMS